MYNPFLAWPITGTWENHMSYSLGGEDYPLNYNTPLPAPASGTLRSSGGSGEFKAGWVGTAGRRSILMLDSAIGDVVAVVFQHQSVMGPEGAYYDEGQILGYSGASASGEDWGGDVHLHIHCLTAGGSRRKFTDYFNGSTIAAEDTTPIQEEDMDANQAKQLEEAHRFSMEVYNAFFRGGSSTPKQLAITDILQPGRVTRNTTRPPVSENGEISFIQEIADAKTLGLNNQDAIKDLGTKLDAILTALGK